MTKILGSLFIFFFCLVDAHQNPNLDRLPFPAPGGHWGHIDPLVLMISILCIGSWFYLIAVYLQYLFRSHPYFHYQCFGMFITFEKCIHVHQMCTYASVIWEAWLPVYSSHHWVFFCLDMSTSRQQLMVCNAKIHRLFSLLYIFHIFCYLTEVYKSDMNPWPNSRRATRDKTLSPKILRTKRRTEGELGRVDLTVFSPISSQPCFCLVLSVSLLSSPLANPSSLSAWKRLAKARNQPDFPTPISEPKQRPINISPGLCIKTRLSAQPLIWKLFFILMMIKIIFTRN